MKVFTTITLVLFLTIAALFAGGKKEAPVQVDNSMMMSAVPQDSGGLSPFIRYSSLAEAMALAQQNPTVLFFNASWCPTCKAAREDFTKNQMALEGVNLILVDYDNSDDLQKKYGVTYQHTFVQIDGEGNALSTWNGGGTEELLGSIVAKEV